MTMPASGSTRSAFPRRAAWRAACSRCCRASSASACSRRRSTRGATACAAWRVLVGAPRHARLLRLLEERLGPEEHWKLMAFPDLDPALEWAEDQLLRAELPPNLESAPLQLAEHPICRGLTPEQVEALAKRVEPMRFAAG